MYARTVVMQPRIDKSQEAIAIFRDSVLPAARQQHGFKGGFLLNDPATGRGMSITLWDTEADLAAGEGSGYFQQQIAKFGPLLAGAPQREVFELVAQAWPQS